MRSERGRHRNRYATRMSTAVGALLLLAVLAQPAAATPAPTCAEGPQRVGETIYGTPCADTIRVPHGVTAVYGEGDGDTIYGGRGNQSLYGGPGNDRLYGGVGDDHLRGGPGDDLLSGGFGADSLDGEEGSDYERGDATIDYLGDSGSTGVDTLSFVTGATPGFGSIGPASEYEGFPPVGGERGVYIDLSQEFAYDGKAPEGGGVDEPLPPATDYEAFETVVGTPFADVIVGGPGPETIYGGGGADVLLGAAGSENHLHGGAGGDYCEGGGTRSSCEFSGSEKKVDPRDPSQIAIGLMSGGEEIPSGVYLDGSEGVDEISATYSSSPPRVAFEILGGPGSFDTAEAEAGECEAPTATKAICPLLEAPDAIDLAGLGGDDTLSVHGFPPSTSIVELGGNNADHLTGTEAEDVLVDGPGNDDVSAGGGDDALPNNQGTDELLAGPDDDLFISVAVCEGDRLDGGGGIDNANWANFESPVSIDLATSSAGLIGGGGLPDCGAEPETTLDEIEDIEGSNLADTLIGDGGENQLLGRRGEDTFHAGPGNDTILANSGTPEPDPDPVIDCGEGFDTAEIDFPQNGPDATPVDCDVVLELPPNSFRPPQTPPGSEPQPPAVQSPPVAAPPSPDVTPPRTALLHGPPHTVLLAHGRRRAVSFAFASNEPDTRFRCRLDSGSFRPCRSPQRYRVGPGRHVFRVFAIDAAGNRDATPVVVRFRVRRISDR